MNLRFEKYQSTLAESAWNLTGRSHCPIALRPICRQLGVRGIRRDRLVGARSLLVDALARPLIILNGSAASPGSSQNKFTDWERFLIAHELGHLVLHQGGAKNPSGPSEYWKVEKLCDEFARRLLIPDDVVAEHSTHWGAKAVTRLEVTLELIKRCAVPWSVVAQKLGDLANDTVFFRVVRTTDDIFKIVVSTLPNRKGIGQFIKSETPLHQTLSEPIQVAAKPREIDAGRIEGLAGLKAIKSSAICSFRGSVCIAAIPG
jgi:hypothetical protein